MSKSKGQGGDYRRTINEQVLLYATEPSFKDVYVEGPDDVRLIRWFLRRHSRNWRVLPIDVVFVSNEEVEKAGLDVGDRGRLLTFGALLEKELEGTGAVMPVIIADRDWDVLLSRPTPVCRACLFTDFTSVEMYGYDMRVIEKLLDVFLRARGITAEEVFQRIEPILVELFFIRAALHTSNSKVGLVDKFTGYCKASPGTGRLNSRDLIQHSIIASRAENKPTVEQVLEWVEQLRHDAQPDLRLAIRGHDFTQLLSWALRPHIDTHFRNDEIIQRALMLALERADLEQYPLFIELLNRTESSPPADGSVG